MALKIGFILALLSLVEAQCTTLPSITLPWGTYQALNTTDDFWHIPNVRFGKNTALTRFMAPESPDAIPDPNVIQDPTYGPACLQVPLKFTFPNCSSSGKPGSDIPNPTTGETSEDCLFLDIYFPKNISLCSLPKPTTPVVVWLYGGAYAFGSKGGDPEDDALGPLYTGQGLIEAAQNLSVPQNVIFVAGNYRLGAFGWLAGPTMEQYGQPNAGLYDQELLLNWVQENIWMVGGDNSSISLWGESAGAGSILHHLVKQDEKPLPFQSALLQSPAYEWQWDNSPGGTLDSLFTQFAISAGCFYNDPGAQFKCVQNVGVEQLSYANNFMFGFYRTRGLFPFGPSVDSGNYTLLPPIALESDRFKYLSSIVVSHVYNESGSFTPKGVPYQQYVMDFIPEQQPEDAQVRQNIIDFYSNIPDELTRLQTTIRDVSFTCNTRYLYDAYRNELGSPVYMMQYSTGAQIDPEKYDLARHASDLIPAFWNEDWDITSLLENDFCLSETISSDIAGAICSVAQPYQYYLASYATTGTPNTNMSMPFWAIASDNVESVMNVFEFDGIALSFQNITDIQNNLTYCGFWLEQAQILSSSVAARKAHMLNKIQAQDEMKVDL